MSNHISCKTTITIKLFLCAVLPSPLSFNSSWGLEECYLLSLPAPRKRRREEKLRDTLPIPPLQPAARLPLFLDVLEQSRAAACICHGAQGSQLGSICASMWTSQTQQEGTAEEGPKHLTATSALGRG